MGLKTGFFEPLPLPRSVKHGALLLLFAAAVFYAGANFNSRSYSKVTIGISVRTSGSPGADRAPINQTGSLDRAIVVARHSEDTSWLDIYVPEIQHFIYWVDDASATDGAAHRTSLNKGNEAMAYLQFILDYYDALPASMVFMHGTRHSWHIRDHLPILKALRWGEVPFANLRYKTVPWDCGMVDFFDCTWEGWWLRPRKPQLRKAKDITPNNKDEYTDSLELSQAWSEAFGTELGPVPKLLHAPCCAEFIINRERILLRPRAFYQHVKSWIETTELDRYRCGRVLEYVWHVIFGEPAVIRPIEKCALLHCESEESTPSEEASAEDKAQNG